MCGRITQSYAWEQVHAFLNVFPRHTLPLVRADCAGGAERA
jgi:hypothetical protein